MDFAEKVSFVVTRPEVRIVSGTRLALFSLVLSRLTILLFFGPKISTESAEITLYKGEIATLKKQLEEQVASTAGLVWKQVGLRPFSC